MESPNQSKGSAQAKGKFLSDMSHEIQNAMKEIMSHSDLMKQTDLNAKQNEYIDTIYASARKLSWVVNDILDFSQLESGNVELQSIEFNLEYLINDVFKKTVAKKKDHPVDTYIDIEKDVPLNLIGDPTRLRQVLVNLLSNAFKFTLKGDVGIIVRRVIVGNTNNKDEENVNIQISVKDTGEGIPLKQLSTIFNLDGKRDLSKSREFGGTKLGLAICKLLVERMGGVINVASQEGEGSAFTIDLMFTEGTLPRNRKVFPITREELVGKKAIIVDDNEIARKILKKCCETMGIDAVLISASPKAVLQMLDEMSEDGEIPDLILCDIMMPEMDGYEMVKRVHANERFKNVKSIAVTSAVHVGSAQNAQDSGFSGFLPKPVFLDELAKVITTVLGDDREDKTIITRHMAEELKFNDTKVLIIEHEGSDQKLIEECLDMMDCDREFVINGCEAIERLKEKIYDVCMIDYSILNEESVDYIKTIKELSQNMPLVALLPSDTEGQRAQCLEVGIDDFVIKPVDMISLKRIIKRYGKN